MQYEQSSDGHLCREEAKDWPKRKVGNDIKNAFCGRTNRFPLIHFTGIPGDHNAFIPVLNLCAQASDFRDTPVGLEVLSGTSEGASKHIFFYCSHETFSLT